MLLKVKGISHNIDEPIITRVTRNSYCSESDYALITENNIPVGTGNFKAILTNASSNNCKIDSPFVSSVQTFDHLTEGDIIVINPDGVINTLYRVNSHQNFLLATERCNSNCLMCSQPPKDRNDVPYLFNIHRQLIPLIPKVCKEIGITGGEPTLMGDLFFELLSLLKRELPDTDIHCLTNGRSFAW